MAKANTTCSVHGCAKPHKARTFCVAHYSRWRKTGSPTRDCSGCGEVLATNNKGGFCSEDCKPRCSVDGCPDVKRYSTGYCLRHNELANRWGTPQPRVDWTPEADKYTCLVCGNVFEPNGISRQFCHVNCQVLYSTYKGKVPALDFTCAVCKVEIRWEGSCKKWRRRDRKICDRCRNAGRTRHKTQPAYLAERDGLDCGICGTQVDMAARWPAPESASVDHIIPVSRGGTHEESNLQLSHWSCNHAKRDNVNFVM